MTNNYIIAGAERQAELEAAKAAFFMGGRQVTELPSRQVLPPSRKNWGDPETVLKRKRNVKQSDTCRKFDASLAERHKLRRIAEAL